MYPLLVSALASTAGNFLERWSRGSGAGAAPAANAPRFENVLDGVAAANKPAPTPTENLQPLAARLRQQVLDAPEVRAVLDSSDPSKLPSIEISPDGKLLVSAGGRDPKAILLSPETAEMVRNLAALTPARGAITSSAGLGRGAIRL